MLSFSTRLELLEADLKADPLGFVLTADLPFALFRYDPCHSDESEWRVRREVRKLRVRVENETGRRVHLLPLAALFWRSIAESEGLEALTALERDRGFEELEEQVHTYLSHEQFRSLPALLAEAAAGMDSRRDLLFLTRATVFAPHAYRASALLEQVKGKVQVPAVLFYPGTWAGSLNYLGLRSEDEPLGNYRVKIYGRE